jgi:excisionase family DNA binding protein
MTTLSDERLLVSIKETARLLDIGRSTVWSLLARGHFEKVKIGRSTRITRESVLALAKPAMPPT